MTGRDRTALTSLKKSPERFSNILKKFIKIFSNCEKNPAGFPEISQNNTFLTVKNVKTLDAVYGSVNSSGVSTSNATLSKFGRWQLTIGLTYVRILEREKSENSLLLFCVKFYIGFFRSYRGFY